MDKVIVYVKHDRNTKDLVKVFIYSSENEEKVKKLCQDDWGPDAHKVGYDGDYGYGYNEDCFSYYHIINSKGKRMKKGFIGILVYAIAQILLLIASKQGLVSKWVAILPLCIVIAVFIVSLFISVVLAAKQVKEKMRNERT